MKTMLADSLTITIKSDGHKVVSASCNDIIVKAKCNDTDTFNLSSGYFFYKKSLAFYFTLCYIIYSDMNKFKGDFKNEME